MFPIIIDLIIMFYLTSNFHDLRQYFRIYGEGEGPLKPPPPQAQEVNKSPGGTGLRKPQIMWVNLLLLNDRSTKVKRMLEIPCQM